jgi:hypothetical protein
MISIKTEALSNKILKVTNVRGVIPNKTIKPSFLLSVILIFDLHFGHLSI